MSAWRRVALFAEAVLFSIIVPGSVAFWLPPLILDRSRFVWPATWSAAEWAALIPLAVGFAIYLRCVWDFVTRGRGIPAPIDHPKALVVTGLYRYVRNPMYLGVLFFLFGEALFLRYGALVVYALVWFVIVNLFVLLYEEPNLERKFGDSYARYRSAVRRWVPGPPYSPPDRSLG